MKVLLFCAKGFETMEFAPLLDVFGWAKMVGKEKADIVKHAMGY